MTDPHRTLATRMIARIANATRLAADATDRRALDAGRTEWDADDAQYAAELRTLLLMGRDHHEYPPSPEE